MAFAVICKSCQARFLLNDDLLRRKVAGKVVTVRCRQCHATIEVDAKAVDPKTLPADKPEPAPPAPAPGLRAPRPAPAPPRPPTKSTLMGIGAPRAAGATELVALSPGLLDVKPSAPTATTAHGFPEPPPPPGAIEVLAPGDWDEIETPLVAPAGVSDDAVPESLDDFAEELPPSLPPEEEMPSSTGTPSLQALTHHEARAPKAPSDDFLANMSAAMNGGIMTGAPTIDVSGLASAPAEPGPNIDVSSLDAPARGAKTLALFSPEETPEVAPEAPAPGVPASQAASASPDGSLTPSILESRDDDQPVESPRERRNVVAPATRDASPAASDKKASGLAVPLLLALAAAAGFLIWKRSSAPAPQADARPEPAAEQAPAEPVAAAPAPEAAPEPVAPAPEATPAPTEELTFETAPNKPAAAAPAKPATAEPSKPADEAPTPATPAAPKEEAKPAPAVEPKPPAQPTGPFDRAAASAALTTSAAQASSCRKEGDPSGVASVVITFAPSGRVTSATISGPPFAGTATGGCIASTLRKAQVPPFEGDRVTVSKTVVIQ